MFCTNCGHEDWCHAGANKEYCQTYEWIKVDGPFPLADEMRAMGLKGTAFETEYGPKCKCSGFNVNGKGKQKETGLDRYLKYE